jgi:hypothetical protein
MIPSQRHVPSPENQTRIIPGADFTHYQPFPSRNAGLTPILRGDIVRKNSDFRGSEMVISVEDRGYNYTVQEICTQGS